MPSVLWHCWLDVRKGIQPVKTEWWAAGMVICLGQSANDLHIVQLIPLPPIISCFSKIQNGSAFLVPTYPGCPGKRPLNECCCHQEVNGFWKLVNIWWSYRQNYSSLVFFWLTVYKHPKCPSTLNKNFVRGINLWLGRCGVMDSGG